MAVNCWLIFKNSHFSQICMRRADNIREFAVYVSLPLALDNGLGGGGGIIMLKSFRDVSSFNCTVMD
jgi:hypothetical protein